MKRKRTSRQEGSHPDELTRERIIAYLATLSTPASVREIAHGMGLKHQGRRILPKVLNEIKGRGDVEEIHGGRYGLAGERHRRTSPSERAGPAAGRAASSGALPKRA